MADHPAKPDAPSSQKLQFSIDDAVANGVYVNFANIIHNPAEFIIDLGRVVPGKSDIRVHSRVFLTPVHAKQLLSALAQNVAIYEKSYGTIRTDFDPPRDDRGEGIPPN